MRWVQVRRRLPKRVYVPLPDAAARRAMIAHLLKGQRHQLNNRDLERIVSGTGEGACLPKPRVDVRQSVVVCMGDGCEARCPVRAPLGVQSTSCAQGGCEEPGLAAVLVPMVPNMDSFRFYLWADLVYTLLPHSLLSSYSSFSYSSSSHILLLSPRPAEGYSGSDLAALCKEAAMLPIRELGPAIATAPEDAVRGWQPSFGCNRMLRWAGHVSLQRLLVCWPWECRRLRRSL
jgi:SpoVK/Ycf46/Vps4 family AAA+-type ATPase